jgi:outer membrane biosynthesis protein TonB
MKRADATDRPTPKPRVKGPDKAKANKTLRNLLIAAGAAGTVGGAAYLSGKKGKDATATTPSKPTPKPKPKSKPVPKPTPKPTPKPKPPAKKGPATGTPPLGGPSDGTKKKKKPMPKPGDRASNRTSFNAGKGVGFGPKGNIFPSNAAERAALMKMYGGTGSKAGKAAQAGTQGDLVAGKAAYEKAKRERLKGKK